ncbi:aminoglycoside phosphotransferase family protein [Mesorhizobium sp. NPDC059054]|uniref:aminoglycoside phosphotransferase family protein n=1 Tax=Mesorhizobium sp. NPDC059054 TaxID=3346711 RepID=UPI0036B3DEBA
MHSDQVHIETELARDLIRDQFPQFEGETIVAVATAGTVNAIFRIGSRYAARFPLRLMDPTACGNLLRAEAAAMNELRACCPFPSPQPVGIGKPGLTYPMPWLVQSWIEGKTATPNGLSGSPAFSLDLASLVTSLRAADVRGRRFDGQGRGGHLPDHDDWMAVCFSNSEGLLDVARLRHMWAVLRELPSTESEAMSHKDLIPTNLLVRRENLIGVLDGGGFGPADPSLDLVVAWHLLDRDRRAVFFDTMQASELERRRSAAWALQQAMGLVWYYRLTNPTMSALGRSTISRLLEDFIP